MCIVKMKHFLGISCGSIEFCSYVMGLYSQLSEDSRFQIELYIAPRFLGDANLQAKELESKIYNLISDGGDEDLKIVNSIQESVQNAFKCIFVHFSEIYIMNQ